MCQFFYRIVVNIDILVLSECLIGLWNALQFPLKNQQTTQLWLVTYHFRVARLHVSTYGILFEKKLQSYRLWGVPNRNKQAATCF